MRPYLLFLIILSVFLLFFHLGTRPLLSSGEARASEIALEMLQRGNWLIPYINEEILLTKPLLFHWLIIFSYKIFGVSEFSSRFPSALAGFFVVIFVYLFGKRFWDKRTGLISSLILVTSPLFFWSARCARIDSLLLSLITISIYCFWRGYENISISKSGIIGGRFWFLGWFFFMGLAVFAKGPVGIAVPLGTAILFLLLVRKRYLLKRLNWFWGIIVFFIVVSPWFIAICFLVPHSKSGFFFWEQILTWIIGMGEWYRGYIYIPLLFLGFFPWSLILPIAFIYTWRYFRNRKDEKIVFLWVWIIIVFSIFCFFGQKVSRYILPLWPGLSLLAGNIISTRKSINRVFSFTLLWMWIFIILFINLYPIFLEPELVFIIGKYVDRLWFSAVGLGVIFMCLYGMKRSNFAIPLTISLLSVFMFILYFIPVERDYYSPKPFCQMLKEVVPEDANIRAYKSWDNSIRYYYGRHVDIMNIEEELVEFLNRLDTVYCFMWDYVYKGLPNDIKKKTFIIKTGYKVMERKMVLVSNKI